MKPHSFTKHSRKAIILSHCSNKTQPGAVEILLQLEMRRGMMTLGEKMKLAKEWAR